MEDVNMVLNCVAFKLDSDTKRVIFQNILWTFYEFSDLDFSSKFQDCLQQISHNIRLPGEELRSKFCTLMGNAVHIQRLFIHHKFTKKEEGNSTTPFTHYVECVQKCNMSIETCCPCGYIIYYRLKNQFIFNSL